MENLIKIFLIDDSEIHLAGLKWLLSENKSVSVTGCAKCGKEVLGSKELTQSDVVLLDISLETESDGLDLVEPIFSINKTVKIIVLSQHKEVSFIVKAIQKGVSAYIAKDTSIDEINAVINLAIKGNGFFLGETIPKISLLNFITENNNNHHPKPWNLSEREITIIELLSKGFISKEIADKLNINITTVESHKENIKQKLGCKTIIEVIVFAMKNGLIS
ncbi:Response regulator receiver domain protein [uncultured Paludibacter sp.]|uniref:Response regulator receiver domain protein n=1 Tax=uncultured Paludibacter sp. TaxID=497635 RepID=A0A653ABW3_9BACT|nr:Response regulator receiver domain protein [uncultured Paludibacter sp.]